MSSRGSRGFGCATFLACVLSACSIAWGAGQQDQASAKAESETRLSAQERVYGLAKIWSEVKYNYPMWYRLGGLNWDAEFRKRIPLVTADQSDWEYYRNLEAFIALVRDAHVSVYPPSELRQQHMTSPPMQLWRVGHEVVVVAFAEKADPQGRLGLGDLIADVDGVPVQEYIEKRVMPYVGANSSQGLALSAARQLLAGPKGSLVRLRLRKPGGGEYDCELRRDAWEKSSWVRYAPLNSTEVVESREVAPGVGYIRIGSLVPKEVVDRFRDALTSLKDPRGLILDLRTNGGGNSGNGDRIMRRLLEKAVPGMLERRALYSSALRGWGLGDWGSGITWRDYHTPETLMPSPESPTFHGKLVLLTSAATASAAEDFAGPLAASDRALVIGEPTAGSTGNPLLFDLPGGGRFRVCTRRILLPDGTEFIDKGIVPDVVVSPTVADVASGRDPVLEQAVAQFAP